LFAKNIDFVENLGDKKLKDRLDKFELTLPADYQLAAKEAVNNKRERLLRNQHLTRVLFSGDDIGEPEIIRA
jgi:hypothetical protein